MPHHPHHPPPPPHHGGPHHPPHHGGPHHPPHHRGYWAPFPTPEGEQILTEMFGDADLAQAATRILHDCPPEIALVVEVVARAWSTKNADTSDGVER